MNLLSKEKKVLLLGNEAVARGALEAGVDFVATYPGTPASEIGNSFYAIKNSDSEVKNSFYFEYSANEKVAMEAGVGASFSGLKTLVAMKHFGLNVAQEALLPFVYTGTVGPTVIAVSDDPSCHSSAQSEQNSRAQALLAHIPTLEPSDPSEAREFTKKAFDISEKYNIPVLVRLTTRVSHQRSGVVLKPLSSKKMRQGDFKKDTHRFVTMPPRVLEMKEELLEKIEDIRGETKDWKVDKVEGSEESKTGIVTSGISYLYVKEALAGLELEIPVLKIGFFYPVNEKRVKSFIKNKERVLVAEELEGWLEKKVKEVTKEVNPELELLGKDVLPPAREFSPFQVKRAVARLAEIDLKKPETRKAETPVRSPRPCPGCPYWTTFGAVKKAVDEEEVVFGGDIGCYMLAGIPQLGLQDYLSCMGSSLGIAHGIKKANPEQKLIAFIGDSTFFHAGLPALANMVFNESNALVIIMDNQITAMTGQQPNPGQKIKIEKVVDGLGVEELAVLNPLKEREKLVETIKDLIKKDKVSVIIARSPCLFIR